jgi:hypothetical protein
MRGERQLLRLGEYLVGRASRQLPRKARDERYREWAAELPVILRDPQVRFAPRRAIRMLAYAADTCRGTTLTYVRARLRRLPLILRLLLIVELPMVALGISNIAQAPGLPLNYLQLAWFLLIAAYPVGMIMRCSARVSMLTVVSGFLAGVAFWLWSAVQDRGDWVDYMCAASLVLAWPVSFWLRARREKRRMT